MSMRTSITAAGCVGVVLGVVAFAFGWGEVASKPFSLPQADAGDDIWTGPPSPPVGATVKTNHGTVRVEHKKAAGSDALGQVAQGNACVFEGGFEGLRVVALGGAADGKAWIRAAVEPATDRLVGAGPVALPAGGGEVRVYHGLAPAARMLALQATTATVRILTAPGGAPLAKADANEWTVCSLGSTDAFYLSGTGAAQFWVYDVAPQCGPYSGTASGRDGEKDFLYLDGSKSVSATVQNTGTGVVRLTWRREGMAQPATQAISAPNSAVVQGRVDLFEWTYEGDGSVSLQIRGM